MQTPGATADGELEPFARVRESDVVQSVIGKSVLSLIVSFVLSALNTASSPVMQASRSEKVVCADSDSGCVVGLGLDSACVGCVGSVGCVMDSVLLSSVLFIVVPSVCVRAKARRVCCV